LKPGTWRSRSSTVWLAEWVTSSRVMTVTAAGASPAFCSIRVGVTTTGSRRAGASGVCAAAGATSPTTTTRTRTAPLICTGVREALLARGRGIAGQRRLRVRGRTLGTRGTDLQRQRNDVRPRGRGGGCGKDPRDEGEANGRGARSVYATAQDIDKSRARVLASRRSALRGGHM